MKKYLLVEIYVKYCQRYTLTTTQLWRMHWSVVLDATSSENYHSQEYLYAYQWGLGYNVKLLYQFKAFHYEGKYETFMVKNTPVTHTTRTEQISSDGICSCNKRWSYNNWKFTMHVKHGS